MIKFVAAAVRTAGAGTARSSSWAENGAAPVIPTAEHLRGAP